MLSSSFDVAELTDTMEAVIAHESFTPGLHVIFDVRGSDINPSLSEVKSMLAILRAVSSQFSGKWAVVVSDALRYGLARMASSLASPLKMQLNVFYTTTEACRWLEEEQDERSGSLS